MAETSGFFDATWDDTVVNPETGQLGDWTPRYLVSEFNKYFSLFVGNGVFINPVNQCKVSPGSGLSVVVNEGFAFINGMWYHNDSPKEIPLISNQTGNNRVDSIRLRYSESAKSIIAMVFSGDTDIVRSDSVYDLKIADIIIPPFAVEVSSANITDTRPDEKVCGFVKGLLEVVDTKDLFSQYDAIFSDFFDSIKDQLSGDLGVKIQQEMVEVLKTVEESEKMISDFKDSYYVTDLKYLIFVDGVCRIEDPKVTQNSLIDVYFTAGTIDEAERCQIYVDSYAGEIVLTAELQPRKTIEAKFSVRIIP